MHATRPQWVNSLRLSDAYVCVNSLGYQTPNRRQAIIRTNAGILLIRYFETNVREILIEIHIFSFKKRRLKMPSGKWRPFCLGFNVLTRHWPFVTVINGRSVVPLTKASNVEL